MTRFAVETGRATHAVDITDRITAAIPADVDGTVAVVVRHTTAGVTVNEAEERLLADIESFLEGVVEDSGWGHDQLDGNADAHLRAMLVGSSVTLPVADGSLDLGTWQSVLLVECDGPRTRTIEVRVTRAEP